MRALRKSFEFFDHKADIGIRGYGKTVEEAFINGAKALFALMIDLRRVKDEKTIEIQIEAPDIETLFVEWLNELLAQSSIQGLVFAKFEMDHIKEMNSGYFLRALAVGETLDIRRHKPKIEVKAATYAELRVERGRNGTYLAQTVVDV